MDLRLHSCSVAPAEGHEKCGPNRPTPAGSSCNNASTNLLERLNEEITRRPRVVRIFPNPARCRRRVRARCADTHEGWLEAHRDRNRDCLKEQKKHRLQTAASTQAASAMTRPVHNLTYTTFLGSCSSRSRGCRAAVQGRRAPAQGGRTPAPMPATGALLHEDPAGVGRFGPHFS